MSHTKRLLFLTAVSAACVLAFPRSDACTANRTYSGTMTTSETWCAADGPHVLTGNLTVAPAATLTLEAGAIVKAPDGVRLTIKGDLQALGTAGSPILLSASNGSAWGGLIFDGTGTGARGTGTLVHATIEQGRGASLWDDVRLGIALNGVQAAPVSFQNCTIRDGSRGLWVHDSKASIVNSTFTSLGQVYAGLGSPVWPMAVSGGSSRLALTGNSFIGNQSNRVAIYPGAMSAADFTLTSQAGLDGYQLMDTYEIPAGRSVTVDAGAVVMGYGPTPLVVRGHLVATGTSAQPARFTCVDTQHGWTGIVFEGGTGDLLNAIVEHGGVSHALNPWPMLAVVVARNVQAGEVKFRNSTIQNGVHGLRVISSRVTLADSTLSNVSSAPAGDFMHPPIQVAGVASRLAMTNCTFQNNGMPQVVLEPDASAPVPNTLATLSADSILTAQTGLQGYAFGGAASGALGVVPAGRVLTFEAGTGLFMSGPVSGGPSRLTVQGRIVASGTAAKPVTFSGGESVSVDGGTALLSNVVWNMPLSAQNAVGGVRVENSRFVNPTNGIIASGSVIEAVNTVFTDIRDGGIRLQGGCHLTGSHLTFARGWGAVSAEASDQLVLTNSIISGIQYGVWVKAGASVTVENTLWDNVRFPTDGPVTEIGSISGSAAFAADGYHITSASAGVSQGLVTAALDDVDGEARPRPAGTLPDLGADEIDAGGPITGRTATPIAVGETKSATAPAGGFSDFLLNLTAGAVPNLKVRLTAPSGVDNVRLLLRRLQFPLPTVFDFEAGELDATTREVIVPAPRAGTWYLSALSSAGAIPFTISVSGAQRGLSSISPATGGNGGSATATLTGVGFVSGVRVELRRAGVVLRSFAPLVQTPTNLTVRLDLTSLEPGACDVAAIWPDGETYLLSGGFQILAGGSGSLVTGMLLPGAVRPGRPVTLFLVYKNAGSVDMPAPLLEVRSVQNLQMRLGDPYSFQRKPFRVLGIGGSAGAAAWLAPGESRRVAFHVIPEGATPHAAFDFTIHVFDESSTQTIDWASLESEFRTPVIDNDAWQRLWVLFRADVGSTWANWVNALRAAANSLSENRRFVYDPALLVASRFIRLAGYGVPTNLSMALDADVAAPGLPLSLVRAYPNSILSRLRLGSFGRGWRDALWETTLTVLPSGEAVVRGASNELRRYWPQPDGTYLARLGDPGYLKKSGSIFTLTETDLRVLTFRADGKLGSLADQFGNSVALTYDAQGYLTRIQHSSGDHFDLAWSGNRVTRLTDHAGRVTIYGYDATGELLTTVTAPDGRVWRYTYLPRTGGPSDLALSSITLPDGTHRYFEYDSSGRYARHTADGGVEPVSFAYDPFARMSSSDAEGHSFRTAFDEKGQVTASAGPGEDWGWRTLDAAGNMVRAVDATGAEAQLEYGPLGHLIHFIDTMGGEGAVSREYTADGGSFARSLKDTKGNVSQFELGTRKELTGVVFPDGSRWQFAVNSAGETISTKNRRGQTIGYVRDARGNIARKDLPDGTSVTYDYDSAGRMTRVSGPEGSYQIDYDSRDFPIRLTQPDGSFVSWEYDAGGKRTRRTTSDGNAVNYSWDAAGRLSEVNDSAVGLLARYSYDISGRLARHDRGNGTYTAYRYTATGRPASIEHHAPGGAIQELFSYEWDVRGNPVKMVSSAGTTKWTWDALNRLTQVEEPSGRVTSYEYDAAGNRTKVTDGASSSVWGTNALNQVTAAGTATFTYDADGNVLSRVDATGTTNYEWDTEGRLVRVTHPVKGVYAYSYDSLGRLASETHGAATTRFRYDGGMLESERDGSGSLLARYPGGYEILARIPAAGGPQFYGFDVSGSTRLMTGPDGGILNRYEIGAFGEVRSSTETVPNPFQFSGRWGVRTEGHGLIRMGARPYDPALGRFLAPDPAGYAAGYNIYLYCGNAPVHYADPSGLENFESSQFALAFNFLKNSLSAIGTGVAEAKPLSPVLGIINIPISANSGIKEIVKGWKQGNGWTMLHGGGKAVWAVGSGVGGVVIMVIELATGGTVMACGVALSPLISIAGLTILASDLFTDAYLEGVKVQRSFEERGPAPRNAYAMWPDQIRPDGTLPPELMLLWKKFHGMDLNLPQDPNEKLNTPGAGSRHSVRAGDRLYYQVCFENIPSASAPAQEVFVDDQIDPNLDLSTLRLQDIGWGDQVLPAESDQPSYSTRVSIPDYRPGDARRWWVDVSAQVNATGLLKLVLRTVDPATGDLPTDPQAGFLPPNDATGRGQGWISFTAKTKTPLAPGTRIPNKASIVFDTNPAITTNEVFNTIGLNGDVNSDGVVNPADVFYLANYFYGGGPAPAGPSDVNLDDRVNALDLFYLINYLYAGGPAPL